MKNIQKFFTDIQGSESLQSEAIGLGESPSFEAVVAMGNSHGYEFDEKELRAAYIDMRGEDLSEEELANISGGGAVFFFGYDSATGSWTSGSGGLSWGTGS